MPVSTGLLEEEWSCNSPKNEVATLLGKDDFASYLECPVCLEIPIPPVYLCLTGHTICGSCRKLAKVCGLCSASFCGTRNFFYENCFEKSTFACRFSNDGCPSIFLGRDLKKHQDHCEFRPLPCLKYGCVNMKEGNQVAYSKYLQHFTTVHDGKIVACNGGTVCNGYTSDAETWVVSRWIHEAYKYQGRAFFVICQIRKPEVGIWLWMLGNEEDAKKFCVKISLGSNKGKYALTWQGPVHSMRKSYEDIMNGGDCLVTSIHAIKAIRKKQDRKLRSFWDVNFEISDNKDTRSSVPINENITLRLESQGNGIISGIPDMEIATSNLNIHFKYNENIKSPNDFDDPNINKVNPPV